MGNAASQRITVTKILALAFIVLCLIAATAPVLWMFLSSLKSPDQFQRSMLELPRTFYYENYTNAWTRGHFQYYLRNSAIATFASLFVILVLGAMIGFAIQKMKWRLSQPTLTVFLSGIMIPGMILLLPQFLIFKALGMYDHLVSLVVAYSVLQLPISIFIFVNFYKYLPDDLMQAAVMDGCSIYGVFFRVVIPLSMNTIVTITVVSFFIFWNELVAANTFIVNLYLKTIQVGLMTFIGYLGRKEWGPIFAGLTISTVPTLALYFVLNRRILTGVVAGSVKG
jgi:raffinose/stachyose/melibiose transport system permease protein